MNVDFSNTPSSMDPPQYADQLDNKDAVAICNVIKSKEYTKCCLIWSEKGFSNSTALVIELKIKPPEEVVQCYPKSN
ncbi:hypothetical protein CDAR_82501 [Caerostris darwini]|uniref:Uncharacterized protein n=1 Tax=Caerostris darwini TaxID=1538125 RepID=A0AAV4UNE7_9ARAC|nr:hypothetical protein CDAR_82501 [Caerostris darwini]